MNAIVPITSGVEILPPGELLLVVAAMHPLKTGHQFVAVRTGSSVEEIVRLCSQQCEVSGLTGSAVVTIDGWPVPEEMWPRVRVKAGAHVLVRARPRSGAGNILKSILQIALIIVATIVAPGIGTALGISAGLAGAGLIALGNFALNALIPPSQQKADSGKQLYSIASRQNTSAKWQPIPSMLGKQRIAGKYAMPPYTEFDGDDQYLYMLIIWGLGPIRLSDFKIGDTLLTDYDDYQIETREGFAGDAPLTLIQSEVVQDEYQLELSSEDDALVRPSADRATRIVVDLVAPGGLIDMQDDGSKKTQTVEGFIRLKNQATGAVVMQMPFKMSGKTQKPIRKSFPFENLPSAGPFNVEVDKTSEDFEPGQGGRTSQVLWTALRTYRAGDPPIEYGKPVAVTALKIRATKQLNGVISDFTAVASSVARSWTGTSWIDGQETRNCGDLARHVLQGPGNARPLPDTMLDLPAFAAFADRCSRLGFNFDMYRDFHASVPDTLRDILAAGRGTPFRKDGLWSIGWDDSTAPIVQHFTPRNTSGFRWHKTFARLPHALRGKFVNAEKDWQEDELIVYADGYDRLTATLFVQVEFPGVTDPEAIFRLARYRLADMVLRPSTYTVTTDFEHLAVHHTSRIRLAHPVLQPGTISGRIRSIAGLRLMLEEPVTMVAGSVYAIEIRKDDSSALILNVVTEPGTKQDVLVSAAGAQEGALFSFGIATHVTDIYRVKNIRRQKDLAAELELVDDAPGVELSDTGPIIDVPGTIVVAPPLSLYRPRNLTVSQSLVSREGATVQVTTLSWQVRPGGPEIQSYLVVASLIGDGTTEDAGSELRVTVPGAQLFAEFTNLDTSDWQFIVQGFTADGRWTGFSVPLVLDQVLPAEQIGVGLLDVREDVRSVLAYSAESFNRLDEIIAGLSTSTATVGTRLQLESTRLNREAFRLDSEVSKVGARLISEQFLREEGDEVVAAAVERAEARLDNLATGQSAQGVVLQSTIVRVSETENGIETVSELLDGVRTQVDDPVSGLVGLGSAVSALQSSSSADLTGEVTTIVQSMRDLQATLEAVAANATAAQAGAIQRQRLVEARSFDIEKASVSRDEAVATRVLGVEARLTDVATQLGGQANSIASFNATVALLDGKVTANAEAIVGTKAQLGTAFAEGLIRFLAVAAPAGVSVRAAIMLRTSANGAYVETGSYYDIFPDNSTRIVHMADKFIITNGTDVTKAFVYEGGAVKLNILQFKQLISDTGRMLIDGTGPGQILFYGA